MFQMKINTLLNLSKKFSFLNNSFISEYFINSCLVIINELDKNDFSTEKTYTTSFFSQKIKDRQKFFNDRKKNNNITEPFNSFFDENSLNETILKSLEKTNLFVKFYKNIKSFKEDKKFFTKKNFFQKKIFYKKKFLNYDRVGFFFSQENNRQFIHFVPYKFVYYFFLSNKFIWEKNRIKLNYEKRFFQKKKKVLTCKKSLQFGYRLEFEKSLKLIKNIYNKYSTLFKKIKPNI
ncbi:hypothetical protein CPARA_3gp452 (nucleomorph) [Cryptomonas paramecium]|uniref:Uncharacterized protein n=1 Tax=Cryptomonas paramaecium TaxID=2898 RepID=F2HI47_9CRYP|nr:hypothetical protein CPARA_3gp452 [Cryptomonas paramecium]AEA39110.1 hypothetical protein CPARA_3gp452 [Cryptomonas paramecium]